MENLIKNIQEEITQKPLEELKPLMQNYADDDYKKYEVWEDVKYVKTLIHKDQEFDLFLLCWKQGQESRIHDHPSRGCLLRVIRGKIQETRYDNENGTIVKRAKVVMTDGEVSFIKDNEIVHKVTALEDTITLHLYSPANYSFNVF